ncbi:MAG: serine protease, partial [Gloeobacteraceae cyanobacterium ES-bin-316]|nr:serine protease [Ferruginibacter sp.]
MFIQAIERVAQFTRPVHSIIRTYAGKQVIPSAGTLFFVNDEGYAITCKHIAEMLLSTDSINQHYQKFKTEKQLLANDPRQKQLLKGLELKYKLSAENTIQLKNNFVDCVDTMSGFTFNLHPTLDLAIIKFNDYNKLHYKECARFLKDEKNIQQGKFLCRLGFPFPEFTNYAFNSNTDDIEWTNTGINVSPRFPIEGMV